MAPGFWAAALGVALSAAAPAMADEAPKYGGILTYMIPADAPPSFDAHREGTFATVHSAAPFYSVLIRVDPNNPSSTTDFVCDLCTAMPQPSDNGKTYTFKIRENVKFHDGSPLTAPDVAASWNEIIHPPEGVLSPRESHYMMVDTVEAPDSTTVIFHLKFATAAFLPALADPFSFIYEKAILDKDPRWYEKNILGSGPFKFAGLEIGQSVKGVRNPDYYHQGLPYLDGFTGIYADKQAVRVAALRSDRNCGQMVTPNHKRRPFDDARVRRALTLAIDRWHGAPELAKIANVRTVGGIVFPGSPLAADKEELQDIAGYWPDIEKSRAEARRLLHEAGADGFSFELVNRNVDQPYKYDATWVIDQWSKIGLHVTQRVLPTGPFGEAFRRGEFDAGLDGECQNIVNPLLDGTKYLPHTVSTANFGNYDDPAEIELYDRMLRETDFSRQRTLMRQFEKLVLDTEAHEIFLLWRYRIVPYRSYVKGWKVSLSHYVNQDLATIWLDR